MSTMQPSQSRRAQRVSATMRVTFWINEGPKQSSDTLNLSNRSLAIRSDYPVIVGDQVLARIDALPPVEGEVVRVFDEGFAVRLSTISFAIVAHAQCEAAAMNLTGAPAPRDPNIKRIFSQMFRLEAPTLSWARIATSRPGAKACDRHYLTIITSDDVDVENIRSVWLGINEIRWVARLARAGKRGEQSMALILLNDWQLHMAASYGLSISIIFDTLEEWSAKATADPFTDHLNKLSDKNLALSA